MIRKNGFVLFYNGEFSQWYSHRMKINGVEYSCCEQWMMAMKAKFFNDMSSYEQIMKTNDPGTQKYLGRTVKNFDKEKWESVCRELVFHGNYAKFQDPILRSLLMTTWDDVIVEASPYDPIWGIGLAENDPRCFDKSKWQGTNWLGEALMRVRLMIKNNIVPEGCRYE